MLVWEQGPVDKQEQDLSGLPMIEDSEYQEQTNSRPCKCRSVCFIVVLARNHFVTTKVEPTFPLVDFSCSNLSLASHRPDSRKDGFTLWDVLLEHDAPMFPLSLILDFLDHGFL